MSHAGSIARCFASSGPLLEPPSHLCRKGFVCHFFLALTHSPGRLFTSRVVGKPYLGIISCLPVIHK